MYYHGKEFPQDFGEAAKWFRMGAEQGNAIAQSKFGVMHYYGKGVPQDDVRAHMWFNLSATQGDTLAQNALEAIATRMTPAELSAAQRLARECFARKYKNCGR